MRKLPAAARPWLLSLLLAVGCASSQGPTPHTASNPDGTPASNPAQPGSPEATAPDASWEQMRQENGITVFRQELPDSPVVAFRGIGDIDAPIGTVALVLMDLEHSNEWIDRLVEARAIEHYSDSEHLTYSHIGAPLVVSDRDFLNKVKIDFTPPSRVKMNIQGTEDPKGPVTKYVRGRLLHSSFELTAIDANKTHLVCEIHADPMGSLPKFIVNYFQKNWAFVTISHLRTQTVKPGIVARAPEIRDLLIRQGYAMP